MSAMKRTLTPEQTVDLEVEPKRAKTVTPEEDASMPAETTCTESPADTVTSDKAQAMMPVPTQPVQVVDKTAAIAALAVEEVGTQPHKEAVHLQASITDPTTQEALPSQQTVTEATTSAVVLPPVNPQEAEKEQDADAQIPKAMQLTESEGPAVVADAEGTQTTAEMSGATEAQQDAAKKDESFPAALKVQESVDKATQPAVDKVLKTTNDVEQPQAKDVGYDDKATQPAVDEVLRTANDVEQPQAKDVGNDDKATQPAVDEVKTTDDGKQPQAKDVGNDDKPACQSIVS